MARTGWVIGRRRAVVIRHRKRINKCQVAQRERGWGRLPRNPHGSRMLQIKFQASYPSQTSAWFLPFVIFRSFHRVFGLAVAAATVEPSVSAAFDALYKMRAHGRIKNRLRAERCIRYAFHFFLEAQCIYLRRLSTAQRFSISLANNFICEAISVSVKTLFSCLIQ